MVTDSRGHGLQWLAALGELMVDAGEMEWLLAQSARAIGLELTAEASVAAIVRAIAKATKDEELIGWTADAQQLAWKRNEIVHSLAIPIPIDDEPGWGVVHRVQRTGHVTQFTQEYIEDLSHQIRENYSTALGWLYRLIPDSETQTPEAGPAL